MRTVDHFEILVIGGGPAGATAALTLAKAGQRVMLAEAQPLPRWKSCGGGIPLRTQALLPETVIRDHAEGHVKTIAIDGAWTGRIAVPPSNGSEAFAVVDRATLDATLVEAARGAGAEVRAPCRCTGIKRLGERSGFAVETRTGMIEAATVILADGVFSPLGRALGFERNTCGFCYEAEIPMGPDLSSDIRATAIFNLTRVRDGYAWAFPRGDVWTIGIGSGCRHDRADGWRRAGALRVQLEQFCLKTPELAGQPIQNLKGGMLPIFGGPRAYYAERGAYVVGDAAGLVDPLSGEGIYYAIQSGKLAAEAILGKGEHAYEELLQQEILPELIYARRFARRFQAVPAWLRGVILCHPRYTRAAQRFADLLSGQVSYRTLYGESSSSSD